MKFNRFILQLPLLICCAAFFAGRPSAAQQQSAQNTPISQNGSGPRARTIAPDKYIIGHNDVLSVDVWKEPEISRSVEVRPDGKISLPLVGELQAEGETPIALQNDIATRLKSFISEPQVTVIVQEVRSQKFNVMGEVARPGTYGLVNPMTVLDALALAGGFKDFAKQTKIYVLRTAADGKQVRLPFNYKQVIKGKKLEQNVPLQPGDTIVVP